MYNILQDKEQKCVICKVRPREQANPMRINIFMNNNYKIGNSKLIDLMQKIITWMKIKAITETILITMILP